MEKIKQLDNRVFLHQTPEKLGEMFVTSSVQFAEDRLSLRSEKIGGRPALAVGTPAVIKSGRARQSDIDMGVASYVARAARYKVEMRRID